MRDHRPKESNVERLRLAIDCMPVATREAMLTAVRTHEQIIVGAYVDGRGGMCPMLAAHRAGGRTNFRAFARSWDRFARAKGESRPASVRERQILIRQLEDSLTSIEGLDLDVAIAEHRELVSSSRRARRELAREDELTQEADPKGEIVARRLRPSRLRPSRLRRRSRAAQLLPA